MKKTIYTTQRGKQIDMESMRQTHNKEIAAGNMGTNAAGDVLGKGREVQETASARVKRKAVRRRKPVNVSLKDPIEEDNLNVNPVEQATQAKPKKGKKKKEVETDKGDIIIDEVDDDED